MHSAGPGFGSCLGAGGHTGCENTAPQGLVCLIDQSHAERRACYCDLVALPSITLTHPPEGEATSDLKS